MNTLVRLQYRKDVVMLACIGLAALWDMLFWREPLGISAAIFATALGILLLLRARLLWKSAQGRVAIFFVGITLIALVEEPSTLAILMACVSGTTLVLVAQRDLSLTTDSVGAWLFRSAALFISLWLRLILDNVIIARWLVRHPRLGGRLMRAATTIAWWILPLLAGALFAGLFAFANPVIANFFSHVLDYINDLLLWMFQLSIVRMFLWVLVGVLTYGILRYRHTWRRPTVTVPPVVAPPTAPWLTGPQMIIRLLLVMNVLFAAENILDAGYLYLNVPLPEGLTYTEYAHRGAYTLIATAMLAAGFTLLAFRPRGGAHRSRVCRWMVYAWIAQNILLLVSTVWRVGAYVETTELTRLRASTVIWCGLVATGFIWIILRIQLSRTNGWLLRMNACTAVILLLTCSFINFDGLIADFNVHHCAESGGNGSPLDVDYLQHLGPPALPAAAWMSQHQGTLDLSRRQRVDDVLRVLKEEWLAETSNWRGWTFRRWREVHGAEAGVIAQVPMPAPSADPEAATGGRAPGRTDSLSYRSPSWP